MDVTEALHVHVVAIHVNCTCTCIWGSIRNYVKKHHPGFTIGAVKRLFADVTEITCRDVVTLTQTY